MAVVVAHHHAMMHAMFAPFKAMFTPFKAMFAMFHAVFGALFGMRPGGRHRLGIGQRRCQRQRGGSSGERSEDQIAHDGFLPLLSADHLSGAVIHRIPGQT